MGDLEEEWLLGERTTLSTHQGYWRHDRGSGGRGRGYRAREFRTSGNSNWRDAAAGPSTRDSRGYRSRGSNKVIIKVPSRTVGRIIGKGGSKIRELELESETKIKIGDSGGNKTEVTLCGTDGSISKVQGMIEDLIADCPPQAPKPASDFDMQICFKINEEGEEFFDWEMYREYSYKCREERNANLPPVIKEFYKEDPVVAAMTAADVTRLRRANNDIHVRRNSDDKPDMKPIPNPVLTFEQAFQHFPEILQEIKKQHFEKPSPIQSQAWPILLLGEDMIVIAQTCTGKTLAFLLPALIHIDGQTLPRKKREGPTVLIVAPTRDLALQIEEEVGKYQYRGIKSVCLYDGGTGQDNKQQIKAVAKGVDMVIATPGRLNDFISTQRLDIVHFSYIVLDEADKMLDMGFESIIRKCLLDVRPNKQTVMTSATWPLEVRRLANSYMTDPIQVIVGSLDLAAVHTVTQQLCFVEEDDKEAALFEFIQDMDPTDKVIIFCGKQAHVSHISTALAVKGIECQSLYGDEIQSEREAVLEEMVQSKINILVATDVASRGIDIKDLTHMVNFDFPRHFEEYVYRVGRTGRTAKTGIALSFIKRNDWAHARDLIKIMEETHQEVPDELEQMAQRFEAMKLKRDQEGRGRGGRGRGGFRSRRGGGDG